MSQPPPADETPREPGGTGLQAAAPQSPVAAEEASHGPVGERSLPPGSDPYQGSGSSRRRRWWIVGAAVAVLVIGAGITWWLWPTGMRMVPGTVQASVVSIDDVSKALGHTLQSEHGIGEPPTALLSDPTDCAVAVGPATRAVYANGWTTFGSVTYQDSESRADHTVTQVIGVYSTGDQASHVFGTLSAGIENCTSAVRAGGAAGQRTSKWFYEVELNTANTLSWTAIQDAGDGWACYRQARLKGRTVMQVAVCGAGDGRQVAAAIADQLATKVSG